MTVAADSRGCPSESGAESPQSISGVHSAQNLAQAVEVENVCEGVFLHDSGRKRGLLALHCEDLLLHCVSGNQSIRHHGLGLPDAVRAVDGLRFHRGIPPRVAQDYVTRRGQIQPKARRFQRKQKHRFRFVRLEFIHEFCAILGLPREHQMLDSRGDETGTNEFEQAHELAEDEHLLALVAELFEALKQRVKFCTRHFRMSFADQCGVTANLAKPEQTGEDVEAHSVERFVGLDAEELSAGAFQFRIVEQTLWSFKIDDDFVFGARRKFGGDLGFRAAQEEVTHAAVQTRRRSGVFDRVLTAERRLRAEQTGLREGEQAPQIEQPVFDWRAGEREPMGRVKGTSDDRGLARGIFDELRFVEYDRVPSV